MEFSNILFVVIQISLKCLNLKLSKVLYLFNRIFLDFLKISVICYYRFEYLWADGTNVKKPIKCSAPKYIDYLMTWVQEQLDDEMLFPSKIGMVFCVVLASDITYIMIYQKALIKCPDVYTIFELQGWVLSQGALAQ